jgi:hypothetical protein
VPQFLGKAEGAGEPVESRGNVAIEDVGLIWVLTVGFDVDIVYSPGERGLRLAA